MKKILILSVFLMSGLVHASAVDYTCAGVTQVLKRDRFDPPAQSVVFSMSVGNEVAITIKSLSVEKIENASDANLTTEDQKGCSFDMEPDSKLYAYRVSISGKCGSKLGYAIKGVCFPDAP